MKLIEIFEDIIIVDGQNPADFFETAVPIWKTSGKGKRNIVRGFRCTSGRKQGQIVASPKTCGGTLDLKKSRDFKKRRKQMAKRFARKTAKTKRRNPASKRLTKLNKRK